MVSLSATKVTPDESIKKYAPKKRKCDFADDVKLSAHKEYSQVSVVIEIARKVT